MSSALISQKSPFGWQMWRGATLELRHSRNFNSSASGGWPERQKESAEAALSQLHTRGDVVQPRAWGARAPVSCGLMLLYVGDGVDRQWSICLPKLW